VVLCAVPLVLTTSKELSLSTTAVVYAIVASGLALLYGRLGILAMSQAGLWGVGAYGAAIAITNHAWSFWTALVLATTVAALIGGLSAIPAFRLRGHYFLITSFIVTQILSVLEQELTFTGGAEGLLVRRGPGTLLGIDLDGAHAYYYLCVVALLAGLGLAAGIDRSRLGRRFLAVRENAMLAEAIGVDTRRQILVGFVISGLYGGVGGALFAVQQQAIQPTQFGLNAAVLLPLVVMLGGARRLWGPVAGAFIVVFLPEVLGLDPTTAQAANGILLILIILLMPTGVLGGAAALAARLRRRRPTRAAAPAVTQGDPT
jgi:branched-chain amino acid transport system permease protein